MLENIKKIDAFKDLSSDDLRFLNEISSLKHCAKDEIVFFEGDSCENIIYLIQGEIKAFKLKNSSQIYLHSSKSGEIITDMACFDCLYSCFTAQCVESSLILNINLKKIKESNRANILLSVMKSLSIKTSKIYGFIDREFTYSSTQKVAQMLILDIDMFNSLKKLEIANILNIKPETLSRVLAKLQKENLISYTKHKNIEIKEKSKLQSLIYY